MKITGMVRRIDDLGRVVIPREIRNKMLIREGDPLEIFITDDGILLKKYESKKYEPDYDFYDRINEAQRRFEAATEMIGHKNTKEIIQRFKEIKELWLDTEIKE